MNRSPIRTLIFQFSLGLLIGSSIPSAPAGTLVAGGGTWKVRQVNTNFNPASAVQVRGALGGFEALGERSTAVTHIDFGTVGEFPFDQEFPGLINGENQFVTRASGQISVTSPGDISFGLVGDDWAQLSIDGTVVVEVAGNGLTTIGSTNLGVGLYDVEVLHYEQTGAETLEVFVATSNGAFATFADANWELLDTVSDPSPTSIAVTGASYPINALQGAVAAGLDALGGAGGPHRYELVYPLDPTPTEVISTGAAWTYLDDGTLPPADWTSAAFDDSLWLGPGTAPLGYGDADIITTLDFGLDANNKRSAYYFRHTFTIGAGELPLVDKLRLRLRRDDGAIVYINGVEVLRDSLPPGPVDNTTLASGTAGGAVEAAYFVSELDSSGLVEGDNTIAVEVHQTNLTSSDLFLDLSLEYDRRSAITGDEQYFAIEGNQLVLATGAVSIPATVGQTLEVSVRAINPCGTSVVEGFEVAVAAAGSNSPTAISLDTSSVSETVPVGTLVGTLSAADLDAGELHSFVLREPLVFFPDNASFTIVGDQLFTAVALDADAQASYSLAVTATDPAGNTSNANVAVTVEPAPLRISLSPDSVPENAPEFTAIGTLDTTDPLSAVHSYRLVTDLDPTPQQLISFGDTWSFLDDGSDQGSAWTERLFDDSSWFSGAAPLGYGTLDVAVPTTTVGFGADGNNKYPATYFRNTFEIDNPALVDSLLFDFALDDGAIIYINGQEVFRIRTGAVDSFDDYTDEGDGGETTNDGVSLTGALAALLIGGTNTIAVEIHQTNGGSSDLWLDLSMQAILRVGGTDEEHFYLVGDQIFLNKEVAEIPAGDGDSFSLTVESTSELGTVVTEELIVNVGPATTNPPTDIALDNNSVDEELPAGTVVGTLSTTDIDGGTFVYSLGSSPFFPDNDLFGVIGDQLITLVPLDVDDAPTRTINITSTDNAGFDFSKTFLITVNFVQQEPTDVTLTPSTFDFEDPIGTVVGTLDAIDENGAEVHTFTFGTFPDIPGVPVIAYGSIWNFLDDGTDPGGSWTGLAFDDGLWGSGRGQLGYGDGDETTTVNFIDIDPVTAGDQKNATTFFRHTLNVATPSTLGYVMEVLFDDAVAVYINGSEVFRDNIAAGALFNEYATATGTENDVSAPITVAPGTIIPGDNVIAVEVHQASETSSDVSFDLKLSPVVTNPYPTYFSINGDQLETAVDFTTVGVVPPPTFDLPIIATDPLGNSIEVLVPISMTGGGGDSDGDGLADDWEIANFGDLSQGAGDDADGDGADNGDEFGADTDPNNAADFLRITSIDLNIDGADIFWPGKPGRVYTLYRSPDLGNGNWAVLQTGLTILAPGEMTANDPAAEAPGQMFYRIEALAPLP